MFQIFNLASYIAFMKCEVANGVLIYGGVQWFISISIFRGTRVEGGLDWRVLVLNGTWLRINAF